MQFDSYRAQRIHETTLSVESITRALPTAPEDQREQLLENLREALAEQAEAFRLPEHVYDCFTCGNQFQSVQRILVPIPHIVTHDAEGTPKFERDVAPKAICPDCYERRGMKNRLKAAPRRIEARFMASPISGDENNKSTS